MLLFVSAKFLLLCKILYFIFQLRITEYQTGTRIIKVNQKVYWNATVRPSVWVSIPIVICTNERTVQASGPEACELRRGVTHRPPSTDLTEGS